jgi:hypothetical protein
VAILATLFGALGRFAGRLLTAALGWASTLLFGRVPQNKQILLVLMTFGSILWVILVLGVLVPDVGTFLLAAVPVPDFIREEWIRLAMLIAALVVPLLIGVLALLIAPSGSRGTGGDAVKSVLRGYVLAPVLAIVLVFLAVVAMVRKVRALFKRWKDAHVAVVVREGGYDQMVSDLEKAIDDAGIDVAPSKAPTVLAMPARLLGAVAGSGMSSLVPDHLVQLTNKDLEIQLYPSDIALAGQEVIVNRARGAIASRLASTSAFMTTSAEAQAVEEKLQAIAQRERMDEKAQLDLLAIDDRLAHLEIPYEEWEVLYRERLQIERDLLAGPLEEVDATASVGTPLRERRVPTVEWLVGGAGLALLALDVALLLERRIAGRGTG